MALGSDFSPHPGVLGPGSPPGAMVVDMEEAERIEPVVRNRPKEPSARERQEHDDTGHVQYRSWCPHCVAARGIGHQHQSKQMEGTEEEQYKIPFICFDYGFMSQNETETLPILIVRDTEFKYLAASCVPAMG